MTKADTLIAFRVTAEQRERFDRAAESDGRSLSSWLRVVARTAADEVLGGAAIVASNPARAAKRARARVTKGKRA